LDAALVRTKHIFDVFPLELPPPGFPH